MRKFAGVICLLLLPCLCGGEEVLMPSKQLYDRFGLPLRSILSQRNTYYQPVPLDQLSPWLISAVIAAEDKRFYVHNGVDVQAVLRAAWQNAQAGEVVSGASTLSQQLARAISPRPKTLWGKAQEAWQAAQLERKLTKEEILEQYFNLLEFGNLTQGVQAASLFYFQVDAADLSLSQAAFLAGLLKSPTYYNPLKHFSRALKRRDYVLAQLLQGEFITREMYEMALAEKLEIRAAQRPLYAPHFSYWLAGQLPASATEITTTIDRELQTQVEQIIQNHLARLEGSNVTNAAVVVLDNATGGILAYAGSADFKDKKHSGQVDGVRALRQPGSALKPFVYALTFEEKHWNPATLLNDEDTFFEGGFRPRNYDESYHGWTSVRTALACSYNIPAVKAAEQVGATQLLTLLHKLGFSSLTKPADFYGLGLALGNGEVRLLELANAYATLARGGLFKPVALATSPDVKQPGQPHPVLDAKTAYLITDILKDNQARSAQFGLNSPLVLPFDFAAKTGTSKDYKDNFALGYTPRWTVGVWVGNFDASPMQKVSGITGAGPILHDVSLATYARYPSGHFTVPKGVVRKRVCSDTGLLASPSCTHTHEDTLDEKQLPATCDGKHRHPVSRVQITSPQDGDKFMWDPAAPASSQQLKLAATCPKKVCQWHVDGQALPGSSCETWWPLTEGKHTISVLCAAQQAARSIEIMH